MTGCIFCSIAAHQVGAVVLYEDDEIIAFLDRAPIRPAHTLIISKAHIPTFEVLPPALANRILQLGQSLAQRMKEVYQVDRVAFLFAGSDVPHVHAHVVALHEQTDITSARYVIDPVTARGSVDHLITDRASLEAVREQLGFVASLEF